MKLRLSILSALLCLALAASALAVTVPRAATYQGRTAKHTPVSVTVRTVGRRAPRKVVRLRFTGLRLACRDRFVHSLSNHRVFTRKRGLRISGAGGFKTSTHFRSHFTNGKKRPYVASVRVTGHFRTSNQVAGSLSYLAEFPSPRTGKRIRCSTGRVLWKATRS